MTNFDISKKVIKLPQKLLFWKNNVITVKITEKVIRYINSLLPATEYWLGALRF